MDWEKKFRLSFGDAVAESANIAGEIDQEWLYKHYQKLNALRDNETTPYWLASLIEATNDKDPVDVWAGLRAVMAIYDDHMADMQEAVEVSGLDS
jgi:hypothetical protein